jgi:vancomycin resistance protein YoaR
MEEIKDKLCTILDNVEDGHTDPLRALIELKELNTLLTDIIKKIEPDAITEAMKYPENTFDYFGATISKSATGARYNWTDDKVYKSLEVDLKTRQEKLKRAVKYSELLVDEETGEAIPVVSMKTPSKSVLRISFKN